MSQIKSVTLTLLLGLVLTACGSNQTVPETRYYILATDQLNASDHSGRQERRIIGLAPLTMAEYLDTDSLIVQTAPHRLQLAKHHRWAELPETAITQALQNDLNQRLPDSRIDSGYAGELSDWDLRLRIQVNQFHGSMDGHAVFTGHWRLERATDAEIIEAGHFEHRVALTQDGYDPLVAALRQSITGLATQLSTVLQRL